MVKKITVKFKDLARKRLEPDREVKAITNDKNDDDSDAI